MWINVGVTRPSTIKKGQETRILLSNVELSKRLSINLKLSMEELQHYNKSTLITSDHYINVDGSFHEPVEKHPHQMVPNLPSFKAPDNSKWEKFMPSFKAPEKWKKFMPAPSYPKTLGS